MKKLLFPFSFCAKAMKLIMACTLLPVSAWWRENIIDEEPESRQELFNKYTENHKQ